MLFTLITMNNLNKSFAKLDIKTHLVENCCIPPIEYNVPISHSQIFFGVSGPHTSTVDRDGNIAVL